MAADVVEIGQIMTAAKHFILHSDPAWRERANFIINAPLAEPGQFEQLWTRQLTEDTFEVCCVPFFLYDVALGDVVSTFLDADRRYELRTVVSRSGRFVYRVHFEASMLDNRLAVVGQLEATGAVIEWSSPTMLAADAKDLDRAREMADVLVAGEKAGLLVFEAGQSA